MKLRRILVLAILALALTAGGLKQDSNEGEGQRDYLGEDDLKTGQGPGDLDQETEKTERPILVKVDQVPYELSLSEPDSLGSVYLVASYENKSDYPIRGFDLKYLDQASNETNYISTYDTVLPGEVSPNFKSSAGKSPSLEDIQPLTLSLHVHDDKMDYYIDYDFKLDLYDQIEIER